MVCVITLHYCQIMNHHGSSIYGLFNMNNLSQLFSKVNSMLLVMYHGFNSQNSSKIYFYILQVTPC